jgi:hypothetical protein
VWKVVSKGPLAPVTCTARELFICNNRSSIESDQKKLAPHNPMMKPRMCLSLSRRACAEMHGPTASPLLIKVLFRAKFWPFSIKVWLRAPTTFPDEHCPPVLLPVFVPLTRAR